MGAAQLALNAFIPRIIWLSLNLLSNNARVVAYVKKQGRPVSQDMYSLVQQIIKWSVVRAAHG